MKFKLIVLSILIAYGVQAQQAGKVGQKFPNEINASSVNKRTTDTSRKGYDKGKPRTQNPQSNTPKYNWNHSYHSGYAEVFIRVPEGGLFSIALDDQELTTPIGMFRFFDVLPGQNLLKIYQNGRLLYQTKMQVDNNKRLVLDFFTYEGLYLLNSEPLNPRMNQGAYTDVWNHTWNDPYNNSLHNGQDTWNPSYGQNNHSPNENAQGNHNPYNPGDNSTYGNHYAPKPMTQPDFEQFKNAVKSQSFEDTKLQMIKNQPRTMRYTANQIKDLMGLFTFDDNRLAVGKYCYDLCVDPQNYYVTYNALTYDSSKNNLMEYIAAKGK